ncbi:S-layer homology domain-containing protein [Peribacillus sp. FSL H8-0477]|uniref:S-layer homology domain-containing protein n=1 Tax=Peribacillus sp. FSL H8-0477 TaxID=2921388 RepID=UPI0030FA3F9D
MAINATTVEVTYKNAVENVDASKYSIEGLTIASAVVKQTDSKTVVLTTSTQEGAKEYTVKSGAIKVGTFKGVSAVIPTAINVTTPSIQGTIGKEVTVKATVTVPEGQSKAGIPVTVNIPAGNSLNGALTDEVYTDANGVATYSYTRYSAVNDNVVVYATGNRLVSSTASVYWANSLTVSEATEGNTLVNGAKKVYKVKTNNYSTAYDAAGNKLYDYVNVAFAENVNVALDKLVRGVEVIDTAISTNDKYPYQVTTGGSNEVRVKVVNGEASFTLTGANSSVTPVVFVDTNKDGKWAASDLQAAAPTVKFELKQSIGLTVKAEGVQNAAAKNAKGTGQGGREYTVTVTDKDGKLAPAGTKAYVTFTEGSYTAGVTITDGKTTVNANKYTNYAVTVGANGQATFTLNGDKDSYATPTVYLENGSEPGLDKGDLQTVGETTYFVDAVINNADLTVKDENDKPVTSVSTAKSAFFHYQSIDQNGFDYYAGDGSYEVSYQVTANLANIKVYGKGLPTDGVLVKKGTTETVKVQATTGLATLKVESENIASNVTINASASLASLPNKTASVSFTNSSELTPGVKYPGTVKSVNNDNNTLVLDISGKEHTLTYTGDKLFLEGSPVSENAFEDAISTGDQLTYIKGDVESFDITKNVTIEFSELEKVIKEANTLVASAKLADYPQTAINAYKTAIKLAEDATILTQEDVDKTVAALATATTKFQESKYPAFAITKAEAVDSDGDKTIDGVKITFNRDIKDSTVEAADFRFYKGDSTEFDAGSSIATGTANDKELVIKFAPTKAVSTGTDLVYAYSSTFSGTSEITDLLGTVLPAKGRTNVTVVTP